MDSANNERIVGYFIEEAKEHLETIEKGILDLSSAVNDEESINELFRAAHSIKGGAAMLNFTSIQKTAHRLEDAFKILRDDPIQTDQTLESLFLKAYDILQDLLERLQGPLGLSEDEGEQIMEAAEPHFVELQNYIQQLADGEVPTPPQVTSASVRASSPSMTAIPSNEVVMQVRQILQQMLAIFKQESNPNNRHQLQSLCDKLVNIAPAENGWQNLIKCAKQAINNPKHSYRLLAPIIIKEVKLAGDCLEVGKGTEIAPSQGLEQLAYSKLPQILISVDPTIAAETISKVFNKEQISKLVNLLQVSH
ncbi:MAG: histidine kinase [Cyanobacteria bacterium]|uniref:Hpt domain-containing protein n=1 Tax=Geminocystis sp. TaxID=2664100 RepID=UPI001D9358C3|nr:histidine kinase [Cyanobacteria bacterium CG_2015-16_32_12]NCO77378.1 histidine kinase [Cyanobacteria bacterium CG_2015-22_32_23]NCQ05770.1 histidine kinase [Cyanobacteria bacterium CG_2015-09_32_10]NCQ42523.1 histidine kinase [Cyanobacteria bacterium CG_2015-04_32_10]NCS83911.1 histidine kinase [Cyanobacteria bacterium CG_2015-02_32_10]